jgi:hypothetical protein
MDAAVAHPDAQLPCRCLSHRGRLAWHEVLIRANDELLQATAAGRPAGDVLSRREHGDIATSSTTSHNTMGKTDNAAISARPALPSSALHPTKLVAAFLARELVLSEKVAAVRVAVERGGCGTRG